VTLYEIAAVHVWRGLMGGRRRRRKVIKRVVRKPPKVFRCPNCDMISVTVSAEDDEVVISCSNCTLTLKMGKIKNYEPVHYYNVFVDKYYLGKLSAKGEGIEDREVPK
jgi:transcription elongation factor Elf1